MTGFESREELRDIRFDFEDYKIRDDAIRILAENVKWMRVHSNYRILIEGHADERGSREYNLTLGERRAKAAMNYASTQGVLDARMTIVTYGKERPLCIEDNEQCWARNRRAHFLVSAQ